MLLLVTLLACRPQDDVEAEPLLLECDRAAAGPFVGLSLDAARVDKGSWIDPMAGSGAAAGDLDGDGLRDLLIPQPGPDQLLLQQPDGGFVDATERLWPSVQERMSAAIQLVDIDGDRDLDVFVCHNDQPGQYLEAPNALYLNDGSGGLSDVSADWGVDQMVRPCYGASFGDLDGDGDLDLALANYDPCEGQANCDQMQEWPSPQLLWEQTEDGFEDRSEMLGERAIFALPYVAALLDADGDLDVDLFLVNDDRQDISWSETSLLYLNDGTGSLALADPSLGAALPLEAMGLGIGDVNGDLAMDMLVPAVKGYGLMESLPDGGWYDGATASGLVVDAGDARAYAWGTTLADIDNDGDLDVPSVYGHLLGESEAGNPVAQPDALYLNDGGTFSEVAAAWGVADEGIGRGLLVIDLDGDGWLDLVKRELAGPVLVQRGQCGPATWLSVSLRQAGSNSHGVGAVITAESGGSSWRRWVLLGASGLSSSGDGSVHFGLGATASIDRLTVTWPDGAETVLTDVPTQQPITIER